jgi:hypothetical protein
VTTEALGTVDVGRAPDRFGEKVLEARVPERPELPLNVAPKTRWDSRGSTGVYLLEGFSRLSM